MIGLESVPSRRIETEAWLRAFEEEYLADFIPSGGSVVRFVSGGASTLDRVTEELRLSSHRRGFHFRFLRPGDMDERERPRQYHRIEDFYKGVIEGYSWQTTVERELRDCLRASGLPVGEDTPIDSIEQLADAADRDPADLTRDVEKYCTQIIRDPSMATEFRSALVSLAKETILHDSGTPSMPEVVTGWLHGEALPGGSTMLKKVGIYDRIKAQNARTMLISFLRWLQIAGTSGAVVVLDIRPYEKKKLTQREKKQLRDQAVLELVQHRHSHEEIEQLLVAEEDAPEERYYSDRQFLLMLDLLRHFLDEVEAFPRFALTVLTTDGFYSADQPRNYGVYNALQTRIGQEVRDSRHPNPVAILSHLGAAE